MRQSKVTKMRVIGITGGVGCGKSTVIEEFCKSYRARAIFADDVAKQLMKKGEAAYRQIVDVFGENILAEDGELDRERLAQIVFANKNKLMMLNSIVHPAVKKYILEEATKERLCEEHDYLLIEAALLIEDHYEVICDEFWYIYARLDVRKKRLKESRGYTEQKIDSILKNQSSEERFRQCCAVTIDNSNSLEEAMAQIKKILEE